MNGIFHSWTAITQLSTHWSQTPVGVVNMWKNLEKFIHYNCHISANEILRVNICDSNVETVIHKYLCFWKMSGRDCSEVAHKSPLVINYDNMEWISKASERERERESTAYTLWRQAETVSEILEIDAMLMWLTTQGYFIAIAHCETSNLLLL
jgi:hypothetical protein